MPTTGPPDSITVGGIVASIVADGYEKGNDSLGNGPWRKIMYRVAWGSSDAFMDALMGIASASTPGGAVSSLRPHQYPGNPGLICQSVQAIAIGDGRPDTKLYAADHAHISATYGVPRFGGFDYSDSANNFPGSPVSPWSRDTCRGYVQEIPLDANQQFLDVDDPTYTDFTGVTLRMPHVEFIRTRFAVPYLFLDVLTNLAMCVNSSVMFGRAIGTILFQTWDTDTEVNTDGTRMQSYTLNFCWRPIDWNREYRKDTGNWDRIKNPTTSDFRYPYVDLTPLLTA